MAGKENKEDKMEFSSSEDEGSSPPKKVPKETSKDEQQGPKKSDKLLDQLDALNTRLNILQDKLDEQRREVSHIHFDRKENSPVWSGNEVVASAISRVRKLQTSETSDLGDGSIGLKASKIPKLELNVDSDISTSSWIAPEDQSPLEGSSFDNSDVTMSPISIWEGRQFNERQVDNPNISRRTWATSSSSEFPISVEIPTLGDLAFSTDSLESTPTPQEEKIKFGGLAAAFKRLTCNTQCRVPQLQSPKQGSQIPHTLKSLSRNLFDVNRRQDLSARSPANQELSGIEPFSEEFSSFSDSSSEQVGVLADETLENISSLDSIGGQKFTHSTPMQKTTEERVQQSESDFFSTDDESFSSYDF